MDISRSRIAACMDVVLAAILLLLFSPRLTGLSIHEWLGLLLILPVLVHLLLSWSWITRATRAIPRRTRPRLRINYLLNWLLFALVVLEIFSGLMISEVVLPPLGFATLDDRAWRGLHNLALNWTHLVLGLHVAMNWQPLVIAMRRYLTLSPRSGR